MYQTQRGVHASRAAHLLVEPPVSLTPWATRARSAPSYSPSWSWRAQLFPLVVMACPATPPGHGVPSYSPSWSWHAQLPLLGMACPATPPLGHGVPSYPSWSWRTQLPLLVMACPATPPGHGVPSHPPPCRICAHWRCARSRRGWSGPSGRRRGRRCRARGGTPRRSRWGAAASTPASESLRQRQRAARVGHEISASSSSGSCGQLCSPRNCEWDGEHVSLVPHISLWFLVRFKLNSKSTAICLRFPGVKQILRKLFKVFMPKSSVFLWNKTFAKWVDERFETEAPPSAA